MKHRVVDAAFDEPSVAEHGLVVGVVSAEGLVASAARGVPEHSAFYIASVPKAFTAMSLMIAADHGALSLDDDIRGIVPELPAWTAGATVRHLLWHTAPLPDYAQLVDSHRASIHTAS